ncbi:MAG TPA: FtsL-like putative cell division protein [Daejeonella sp.]|nr:FtsL-like putative cell division protein [Daejeonella sp.]
MSNRFRNIEEEEDGLEPDLQPKLKREISRNFFTALFTEGVMSKQAATDMLPYIIYVAFLGMIYIGNRHLAENNIRDIDKLGKEVKELSWDFKTLKADLMLKSTQTEVAKLVDTLGLKEPAEPPKKILVASDEY